MNIIEKVITYVIDFAYRSQNQYGINPWVFCALFFGSAVPLYYGYYRIAKSALQFEERKLKMKKLDRRGLKLGVVISIISWWIPYVYVIIFGKLTVELWLMLGVFILVIGGSFVVSLRKKVLASEQKDVNTDSD